MNKKRISSPLWQYLTRTNSKYKEILMRDITESEVENAIKSQKK